MKGIEILREDGPLLLLQKPVGVLTQAPPGIDSMEVRIQRFLRTRDGRMGYVYVGVPHRLDRPVSGAMVFVTSKSATRRIAEQFQGRLVKKTYWAIVEGDVHPDEGTWTDYVCKVPREPRTEIVDSNHKSGKIAVLHYRVRERSELATWLEIELETGRTHQIRIQAGSRAHAVFGDGLYGSQMAFGPQSPDEREHCIALHSRTLTIRHPKTRESISATAPLPDAWLEYGNNSIGLGGWIENHLQCPPEPG